MGIPVQAWKPLADRHREPEQTDLAVAAARFSDNMAAQQRGALAVFVNASETGQGEAATGAYATALRLCVCLCMFSR